MIHGSTRANTLFVQSTARLPPRAARRGDAHRPFDEFVHTRQSNLLRLTVPYMVPGTGFTCYSRSMTTLRRLVEGARSTQ